MYGPAFMPFMNMMGLPQQCNTMLAMPQQQLEKMYPRTYYVIQPVVNRECDRLEMQYGKMYTPSHEQMEGMIDKIYAEIEADIEIVIKEEPRDTEDRQIGFSGRRVLRDLISVLLIRNLTGRRCFWGGPFGFGYGGFGPGYGFSGEFPLY